MPGGPRARSGKRAASSSAPRKAAVPPSRVVVSGSVKQVYKTVQKRTGQVGGYGHDGPVYGEITVGSMQKIVDFLKQECGLDQDSLFLDVGAGLGKPNFHVSVDPGVRASVGVEVEQLRWLLSLKNLQALHAKSQVPQNVCMLQRDATKITSFDPFTVVYQFDVGFPPKVFVSIANSFNRSVTVRHLVSFKPPRDIIDKYGFSVKLVGGLNTSMAGSTESHKVYFYESLHNVHPSSTVREAGSGNEDAAVSSARVSPRRTQLQISSLFRATRGKRTEGPKGENEGPVAKKKKSTAGEVGVAEAGGSAEAEGNDSESAESGGDRVDPAFREAFKLMQGEDDAHAVWMAEKIEGFFGGGRPTRPRRQAPKR